MRVVFVSNFLNHHQLPIAQEFYSELGEDFLFIATEKLPEERQHLGYHDMNGKYPFSLNAYEDENKWDQYEKIIFESDVVIFAYGSAPISLLKRRIRYNKLTFFYMERICKKQIFSKLSLRRKFSLFWHHGQYTRKNVYILCASAYTSLDFSQLHVYKGKMFKWGYFPHAEGRSKNIAQDEKVHLIWVGRFIDWKHPELAIYTIRRLLDLGYENLHLKMIGVGPLMSEMHELVTREKLSEYISFEKSMPPEEVRKHMNESDILLMTSDQNEGWGAVLNEGMNSGCVPIVNRLVGSAPYLVQHGINGMCYNDDAIDEIVSAVQLLIDDKEQRYRMSEAAISTILECWNEKTAVQRFLHTVCGKHGKLQFLYENGPMSEAIVIDE